MCSTVTMQPDFSGLPRGKIVTARWSGLGIHTNLTDPGIALRLTQEYDWHALDRPVKRRTCLGRRCRAHGGGDQPLTWPSAGTCRAGKTDHSHNWHLAPLSVTTGGRAVRITSEGQSAHHMLPLACRPDRGTRQALSTTWPVRCPELGAH